jgi:RHS repeat-associated protein
MDFDPWGGRRAVAWNDPLSDPSAFFKSNLPTTHKGFTGHETVDEMGIVHMNGRIYDARIARFLQADPFVQAPKNTQSMNRYSYTWNNPLNATDPSGYFLKWLG